MLRHIREETIYLGTHVHTHTRVRRTRTTTATDEITKYNTYMKPVIIVQLLFKVSVILIIRIMHYKSE